MRIIIDARAVGGRSDGMSNYVRHLVIALLRLDQVNDYVLLLHQAFAEELTTRSLLDRSNVRPVVTAIPFMGPRQQVQVPPLLRGLPPADVYHYPHFDMPWFAHARSVVTVFDLNQFHFTGYFDSWRLLKRGYSLTTTAFSLAKARRIITISQATKQRLLARFAWLDPQKVTVTYFGLNERFLTPPKEEDVEAFRQRYRLGHGRYLLYVGTARPHKNLSRVLEAYRRLRRQMAAPPTLLIVGPPDKDGALGRMISALRVDGAVVQLGYLPDEELVLAYRVAEALAFCSLSEGFGMPLLEAMASEVPVVTSQSGATAEIAGGSAVLVDPLSADSIAGGLFRILTSQELRRQCIARGCETVRRFTWEDTARKTLEVYRTSGNGCTPFS